MGLLVDGVWHDEWYDTDKTAGEFKREGSQFRNWVTQETAASGRYHLYVSKACPWAHRTLIFRELKQLQSHIEVSFVQANMLSQGWEFDGGDQLFGYDFMHQVYTKAKSDYTGRVTVPVLWDTKDATIASNESADIIRMFNSAFNLITGNTDDYYPSALQGEIDALNENIYASINNGVYRCGFATSQAAYDYAFEALFATLDELDKHLVNGGPYLCGEVLTEADWRLFTTLIRFDLVYVGHFKCNLRRIQDYPALSQYLKRLYNYPGIAATVDFAHIKQHYYYSHIQLNPTQIVPIGPDLTWLYV